MSNRDLLELDKFDLVNMLDAIQAHSFLLRLAFVLLGEGSCWEQSSEENINQGLILIDMYLKHLNEIVDKGVY